MQIPTVRYSYGLGDGTVLTTSALTPGIKWANDFNKRVAGSKPINMIEICGTYQRRDSVFDSKGSSNKVTKNAFFGIDCTCKGTKSRPSDGTKCASHMNMVFDSKLINFVINSAIDKVPS